MGLTKDQIAKGKEIKEKIEHLDVELVSNHDYRDVYRIVAGTLLVVHKYDFKSREYVYMSKDDKRHGCKKFSGISDAFVAMQDLPKVKKRSGDHLHEGDIVIDGCFVSKGTPDTYHFEIKSSGGTIEGNFDSVSEKLTKISEIINMYRLEVIQ